MFVLGVLSASQSIVASIRRVPVDSSLGIVRRRGLIYFPNGTTLPEHIYEQHREVEETKV